jgi:hypothetical protein
VKLPSRDAVAGALLLLLVVAVVLVVEGWRSSHRGGFSFFSIATLQALWPLIVLLLLGFVAAWFQIRRDRNVK